MSLTERLASWWNHNLWEADLTGMPAARSAGYRVLRVLAFAAYGSQEHLVALRASALTLYTLMSLVPTVAMTFGVAHGFGFAAGLEQFVRDRFQGPQEALDWILQFSGALLQSTGNGLVTGIGVIVLFWSAVKVLGQVENAFNAIWGVRKGRPFLRRFSNYLSLLVVGPGLLTVSGSVTVLLAQPLEAWDPRWAVLSYALRPVLLLLSSAVIWFVLTLLYMVLPHAGVSWRAGTVAGLAAALVYQLIQWIYIEFQVGVSSYNAIYGSFAALPLFLVWLHTSWQVVLFGAQFAFAIDHVTDYRARRLAGTFSPRLKRLLAVRLAELSAKAFDRGLGVPTTVELADALQLPVAAAEGLLADLVDCGVLSRVVLPSGRAGYQPAQPVLRLTVARILELLDRRGVADDARASGQVQGLSERLDAMEQALESSGANVPVTEL